MDGMSLCNVHEGQVSEGPDAAVWWNNRVNQNGPSTRLSKVLITMLVRKIQHSYAFTSQTLAIGRRQTSAYAKLATTSGLWNYQVACIVTERVSRLQAWINISIVYAFDIIWITFFLYLSKFACNTNEVHQRVAMWALQVCIKKWSAESLNSMMALRISRHVSIRKMKHLHSIVEWMTTNGKRRELMI